MCSRVIEIEKCERKRENQARSLASYEWAQGRESGREIISERVLASRKKRERIYLYRYRAEGESDAQEIYSGESASPRNETKKRRKLAAAKCARV